MSENVKKQFPFIILTTIIFFQVFLLLFNEDINVGGENRSHFQIARFSFEHPELFLDLEGKPVFTVLLAPFTLLGYHAAKSFNLIVAILTLVLTAKLSDKIFKGVSNYTILIAAFSPVYFFLMITCLPEMLLGLFAVGAVYLFSRNKFYYSAIVISFIPFIQYEGVILFPVFALAFLMKRNLWPVFFLGFGTVLYTIIGFFAFNDWLWIIHKFPYSLEGRVSEGGSLIHFVTNSTLIFGTPFLILMILGFVYWLFQNKRNFSMKDENIVLFLLISGSCIAFLAFQFKVWWKETEELPGILRLSGAVTPLAALIAVKGFQFISEKINGKRFATGIIILCLIIQVFLLFMFNDIPTKIKPDKELLIKSSKYIKQADFSGKVYCLDPEILFQLGIDPYNQKECGLGIQDKIQPSDNMEWGDLLVWDSNFGSINNGVKLGNLEKDPFLKKIKSFYLLKNSNGMAYSDYNVQIFKKSVNKNDSVILSDTYTRVLSFENSTDKRVIEVDGFKVWKLDNSQEYSPNITLSPDVVKRYETFEFDVKIDYKTPEIINGNQILLVFSAENDGKALRYEVNDLAYTNTNWKQASFNIKMPANTLKASTKILTYVWNTEKKMILIKNITVNVKSY